MSKSGPKKNAQPMFKRIALIGVGLIGSSISHGARRAGLAGEIVGAAKTEATRATALKLGLISKGYADPREAVRGADLVILCVPVGACGKIAAEIGHPRAVRAVGSALAHNPVPLVVPCHRVVRSDGSIGQYSLGGPDAKRTVLAAEGLTPAELETAARAGGRYLGSATTRIVCPRCFVSTLSATMRMCVGARASMGSTTSPSFFAMGSPVDRVRTNCVAITARMPTSLNSSESASARAAPAAVSGGSAAGSTAFSA